MANNIALDKNIYINSFLISINTYVVGTQRGASNEYP